jgi:uncharacterized membrane protein (UPF0127 family)
VTKVKVRVADNKRTRAAGFQKVCEKTIRKHPILFEFDSPILPAFHMHNVVAPLDIAFIDESGIIDSIQTMLPYVQGRLEKPLYSPKGNIVAALEAHKGYFAQNNIDLSTRIYWKSRTWHKKSN